MWENGFVHFEKKKQQFENQHNCIFSRVESVDYMICRVHTFGFEGGNFSTSTMNGFMLRSIIYYLEGNYASSHIFNDLILITFRFFSNGKLNYWISVFNFLYATSGSARPRRRPRPPALWKRIMRCTHMHLCVMCVYKMYLRKY